METPISRPTDAQYHAVDRFMNNDPNENQHNDQPHLDTAWSPVADAMRHGRPNPVTKQGNPIDPADPGSPSSRVLTLLITVLIVTMVILWTNTSTELKAKIFTLSTPPAAAESPDQPASGNFGQIDIPTRLALRGFAMFKDHLDMSMVESGNVPLIDEDYVRIIMFAGEIEGDEAALQRIEALKARRLAKSFDLISSADDEQDDKLEAFEEPDDLIASELNILEAIYTFGIDALEENERDQIAARYGLVGKVALTHGLENSDPRRQPLIDGWVPIVIFMLVVGLGVLFMPFLGLTVLIIGIVYLASGRLKLRNHIPAKGGSVFLETYAFFVGAFLLMIVAAFFFPKIAQFTLILQWLLLGTIFWGLVRGMRRSNWQQAIGWHKGEGVLKEIGCGILVYIASIPVFIAGTVITFFLLILQGVLQTAFNKGVAPDPEPITNPLFEVIASGDFITVALLFFLATTWAPIVEEAIFRGALFRHLRSSMHWVYAALISAFLFAFMHSYGPLMVSPLIALGFMFAFMREWRGSLIAPMTAHFLHNFTMIGMMILFVLLIR